MLARAALLTPRPLALVASFALLGLAPTDARADEPAAQATQAAATDAAPTRTAEPAAQAAATDAAPTRTAEPAAAPMAPAEPAAAEPEPVGVSVYVGFWSVYPWRGANVFATDSLRDQNGMVDVGMSYTTGGFTFGYWSAYQVLGDNILENIAGGLGDEQDLTFGYDFTLPEDVTLSLGTAAYLFPFAQKEQTGTAFTAYLEPSVAFAWDGPVSVSGAVSYYAGAPKVFWSDNYLYLHAAVGGTVPIKGDTGLDLSLGFGHKLFTAAQDSHDNREDLGLTLGVPLDLGHGVWVSPTANLAWTNLADLPVADELMPYIAVEFGLDR